MSGKSGRSGSRRSYIDVFAGCGGLSLGLHAAGWEGLFAIERDPMAFETLSKNMLESGSPYQSFHDWPDWLPQTNIDIDDLLDQPRFSRNLRRLSNMVSLLAGGPPCQGFSVGGRRDGSDSRNFLVHRMLKLVDIIKPPLVLIENVEGMARRFLSKPARGSVSILEESIDTLYELGYSVAHFTVDSSHFGVPQIRNRVIIVGASQDALKGNPLEVTFKTFLEQSRLEVLKSLGLGSENSTTVWEAIHDLAGGRRVMCPDSPKFEAGSYKEPDSDYAKLMRNGIPNESIPNSHRFTKHGDRIRALYESAHATQRPGRLSKSFLLENGTKKDKKVLLDKNKPASTITTHPDEFIHYSEPRNVTVREMARLQSFPDDFNFFGRYTINGPRRRFDVARCSQVGNAVPPLLARVLGVALERLLNVGEAKQSRHADSSPDNDVPARQQHLPLGL